MNRITSLAIVSICSMCFSVPARAQISDPYNNKVVKQELKDREIKDKKAFKQFSNKHFPGLLEYFSRDLGEDSADLFEAAAEELVDIFEEYQEMISDRREEEIEPYMNYKGSELRSWKLGKEIMVLRQAQLNGATDANQKTIEEKEAELYRVLEKQYSLKLEYQKKEFEEMRRELAALEQALKKRSMLKEQIIRRRILELTGDDDVMDWD